MNTLKTQLAILLFSGLFILFQSCSNLKAENNQPENNIPVKTTSMEVVATTAPADASAVAEILIKAKADGKAVFVVVTDNGSADTEKALSIANSAKAIYKNAEVVEMNRDNATNAELVNDWRLTGAPVPLILVVSPKGQLAGGRLLEQATAENVAELVPSPKLEMVYEAIANNKYAIVAFTKPSFNDRAEVLKKCNEAVSKLKNEAVLVEVNMEDKLEAGFLKQVRINEDATQSSITLVINKQGQVSGTSTTIPDADKLVAAAITPVRSGCGPGCGPAGCGQ